jgi:tetratricopeptide (TPR) repeat protein
MKRTLVTVILLMTAGLSFAQLADQGKKLYSYERYGSAIQLLQKAVTANPADIDSWYWLIKSQLAAGNLDSALYTAQKIPASLTEQPLAKVIRGEISLHKADSINAAILFTEAIGSKRKKDPLIQWAVARAMVDAPKTDLRQAIVLLEEAGKKDAKNADIAIATGDAYRKLYDGSSAVKAYQEAIDADPRNAYAYYMMGKIYQTQNNVEVFTDYYNKAIAADPDFAPVYYPLYYYYYFRDVNKALEYLQSYIARSDDTIEHDYMLTDLYYVSKKNQEAIQTASRILTKKEGEIKPRLYKLMAYSYEGLEEYNNAEKWMKDYFAKEADSNYVSKDFELMAKIAVKNNASTDAAIWYEKAFQMEKDSIVKLGYVKKITALYKEQKNYAQQATWTAQQYKLNPAFNNVDLFNWGVAYYNAKDYTMADSVFGIYASKYPDQTFGFYWRARCNAAIDTAMETGIAIPHYEDMIEVAVKDTANANNKKWLIQAYGYIAAYRVNTEKKYDDALALYDKILELDPANDDAEKYKEILEKMKASQPDSLK